MRRKLIKLVLLLIAAMSIMANDGCDVRDGFCAPNSACYILAGDPTSPTN